MTWGVSREIMYSVFGVFYKVNLEYSLYILVMHLANYSITVQGIHMIEFSLDTG